MIRVARLKSGLSGRLIFDPANRLGPPTPKDGLAGPAILLVARFDNIFYRFFGVI